MSDTEHIIRLVEQGAAIYEKVVANEVRMIGIEERMVEKIDDHETRIRANEKWRWRIIGAASVVAVAISTFFKQLWAAVVG